MMKKFRLLSKFKPTGDQPQAIKKLVAGLKKDYRDQTLLGVTGSGKTFTMANVIARLNRPTLVISPNKTLAAQLASEFKEFFPRNAVNYFVSYYDYYQPEAYLPQTDTYIEKETNINEEIDRLRNAATRDLMSRDDVIIVASVSCIYGLGNPEEYQAQTVKLKVGAKKSREETLRELVKIQYDRNDIDFRRGTFRVKGENLEVFPAGDDFSTRIEFFGNEIEKIYELDPLTGRLTRNLRELEIFPARHFITPQTELKLALINIRAELKERVAWFKKHGKELEAERLNQRTNYDLEMIATTGYCNGIENYSRHLTFRRAGEPSATLLNYFPKDFLVFIDESHLTIPQIRGMYAGDRSRKNILVDYGFRLPSALDNRPLRFEEFDKMIRNIIYVSATPQVYERRKSRQIVEQLLRPTGLLDPAIEVRPTKHQVDDLLSEIKKRVAKKQRVLVTTLTKRMAEDLAEYLGEMDVKVHYLHSEVETLIRLEILRDLRLGHYDVVVGINLLREGLDLPEVSLVAILDADKEGYLRSATALIQTMGRASRHLAGRIIMYADKITTSMKEAIAETKRRRKIQEEYNKKHRITPKTIVKAIREDRLAGAKRVAEEVPKLDFKKIPKMEIPYLIKELEKQMDLAARNLEFEKAARLRDEIRELRGVGSE